MIRLKLFIAAIFISFISFAQEQEENSLLWEITGNGLQQPSYLFGTIHMICKEDFFMPELVKQKFAASGKVFLEFDMDDPLMQIKMMKLAMLPKGETLKTIFGKDYALLDSFFKTNSTYPLAMFNQFKPMMVMSMITMEMLPCDGNESYENSFMSMAKNQGKDILGLETMEDQMKVFDDIPDSIEAKNIIKMINEFELQKKQFAEMVEVYKQQNIHKLQAEIVNSPDIMGAEEALLTNRNNNWIPVIEKNIKETGCFFAVGAGHLAGEKGVIQLLRKAGYTVKAIKI
jgi:uncharacterized protein YbaP (TraB family)